MWLGGRKRAADPMKGDSRICSTATCTEHMAFGALVPTTKRCTTVRDRTASTAVLLRQSSIDGVLSLQRQPDRIISQRAARGAHTMSEISSRIHQPVQLSMELVFCRVRPQFVHPRAMKCSFNYGRVPLAVVMWELL